MKREASFKVDKSQLDEFKSELLTKMQACQAKLGESDSVMGKFMDGLESKVDGRLKEIK